MARKPRPDELRIIKLPVPLGLLTAIRREARVQGVAPERMLWTCLRLGLKRAIQLRLEADADAKHRAWLDSVLPPAQRPPLIP